jgi:hypothetical protein
LFGALKGFLVVLLTRDGNGIPFFIRVEEFEVLGQVLTTEGLESLLEKGDIGVWFLESLGLLVEGDFDLGS